MAASSGSDTRSRVSLTPNEVYDCSSLDLHGQSLLDSSRHQSVLQQYHSDDILDLTNKNLTDHLEPNQRQLLIEFQGKVLIFDSNSFLTVPEECTKRSIEYLSIAAQIQPKKASLSHRPVLKWLPESIGDMTSLREIKLLCNDISSFPSSFEKLKTLEIIDLTLNSFRIFPPELLSLPNIKELYLSANQITELPREIGNLGNLEVLRIGNNDLKYLPQEMCKLSKLKQLSVRNNNIIHLPRKLHECKRLLEGELIVSDNPLIYPPKEVWQAGTRSIFAYLEQTVPGRNTGRETVLKTFDHEDCLALRQKKLTDLECVNDVQVEIQQLDACDNELPTRVTFPSCLEGLNAIHLANNKIVVFPLGELQKIPNLKTLNLNRQLDEDNATLCIIPTNVYELKNLTELFLCQNRIASLPDGIFLLQHLEVLDLQDNELTTLPDGIQKLKQLQLLGLRKNMLTHLPDAFGKLLQLKVLSLSWNKVTVLPDSICDLKNLHTLSLRKTCLQKLPLKFYQLEQLLIPQQFNLTAMNQVFQNGCLLEGTTDLHFPSPDVIKQGLQAIFHNLRFWEDNPHLLEENNIASRVQGRQAVNTLTDEYLGSLSKHIGSCWEVFAAKIGLEFPDIKQHRGDTNAAYSLLINWRNKSKYREETMIGKLANAMDYIECPQVAKELRGNMDFKG